MTKQPETIVWVSGATEGIGESLAATVPYAGARVINMSRRQHPTLETIQFDLTDPMTWDAVGNHFKETLAVFAGKRAIFIHNAFYRGRPGFVGTVDQDIYRKEIIANGMAPMVLGDMFIRAVRPDIETGLVMISSASARSPLEGHSAYCGSKAGVEMWVRVVRRELRRRGMTTWVVAIRPGFVDTPATRAEALFAADIYPLGPHIATQLESGKGVMTPLEAGRGIWQMLPPRTDESVLLQGEMVVVEPKI